MPKKVTPIKKELRPLIEAFLADKYYADEFSKIAIAAGCKRTDLQEQKCSLFAMNKNGDIGFVATELYDMFASYQAFSQIKDKEPFKTALTNKPEIRKELEKISLRLLNGEEVREGELTNLIK